METVDCNFALYTTEMNTGLYRFRCLGFDCITTQAAGM